MSDFLIEVAEIVSDREFWIGVAETLLGLLSFAAQWDFWIQVAEIIVGVFSVTMLIALSEWYRTTKRLKKYVKEIYLSQGSSNGGTKHPSSLSCTGSGRSKFCCGRLRPYSPGTPKAYRRVEEVRDVLEEFHRGMIPIFKGTTLTATQHV